MYWNWGFSQSIRATLHETRLLSLILLTPQTCMLSLNLCQGYFFMPAHSRVNRASSSFAIVSARLKLSKAHYTSHTFDQPVITEMLETFQLIRRREISVVFSWAPKHVGIHGNKGAARLANETAISRDIPTKSKPLSNSEWKSLFHKYYCTFWNDES